MPYIKKTSKLIRALNDMIGLLEGEKDLAVHQELDQFYFMSKAEELRLLSTQLKELRQKEKVLQHRLGKEYKSVFTHWRRGYRWLHHYLGQRSTSNRIK